MGNKKREPVDRHRCQAEISTHTWATLGPKTWSRCKKSPFYIATEKRKGPDGKRGSMSLCQHCAKVMENQQPGFATVRPLAGAK